MGAVLERAALWLVFAAFIIWRGGSLDRQWAGAVV